MATFEMGSSMAMASTLGRQVCRCVCIDRRVCARIERDSWLPKRAPTLPPPFPTHQKEIDTLANTTCKV